jgi:hypothetical protein
VISTHYYNVILIDPLTGFIIKAWNNLKDTKPSTLMYSSMLIASSNYVYSGYIDSENFEWNIAALPLRNSQRFRYESRFNDSVPS